MISQKQAETKHAFHINGVCKLTLGTRGRLIIFTPVYHSNGKIKTWHDGGWRLPIKRGLYEHGEINNTTADRFHLEEECQVLAEAKRIRELDAIELGDLIEAKYTVTN